MWDKIMSFMCMAFGVAGLSLEFNRLHQCSVHTTATITEVNRQRDARGLPLNSPVFEFIVDGRLIRGNGRVPGSLLRNRYREGEIREILYEAGNPENFRLRGTSAMLLSSLLFLVVGIYVYLQT